MITTIKLALVDAYNNQINLLISSLVAVIGLVVIASTAHYFAKKPAPNQHHNYFIQSAIVNVAAILLGLFIVNSLSNTVGLNLDLMRPEILAMLLVTSYSLWVLVDSNRFQVFARNAVFHLIVLVLTTLVSWLLLSEGSRSYLHFAIYPSMILGVAAYVMIKKISLPSLHQVAKKQIEKHKQNADLLVHSYAVINYLLLLSHLSYLNLDLAIAPILAAHGTAVLFLKNRRVATVRYGFVLIAMGILKLAVIDTAQVILWQKVVLFIGIGVFILFASFWYQKIITKDILRQSLGHSPSET